MFVEELGKMEKENVYDESKAVDSEHCEEDSALDEGCEIDVCESNPGWADAMARVLRLKKPRKSRSIVLSKAKKLTEVKNNVDKEKVDFEIDGDTKQNIPAVNEHLTQRKQRELQSKCRVKPSILDRERERRLNRIATKGVVQLFNAVRQQQKMLESHLKEAGSSERKKDKILKSLDKRAFLDVLMGASHSEPVDNPVKLETEIKVEETPVWEVLRDDFMMGKGRLKDWDKTDTPT
ncbi:RRP15-like protein [Periplaneta americana]|uniref:RRP15-like protein n=1 Tax=Periplaneta americana TaxID=6978 RepID=UPI0037E8E65E